MFIICSIFDSIERSNLERNHHAPKNKMQPETVSDNNRQSRKVER